MDRDGVDHYAKRLEQRNPFSPTAVDDAFRFASQLASRSLLAKPWARLTLGREANRIPPTTARKALDVEKDSEQGADSVGGTSDSYPSDSDGSLDDRQLQAQGSVDDEGGRQPLHLQHGKTSKLPTQGMARTSSQSTYAMSPDVGRTSTTYHKPKETSPWSGLEASVTPIYEHDNIDANDSMHQTPANLPNNVREDPWALLLSKRPMLVVAAHYTISRDANWAGVDERHLEEREPQRVRHEAGQLDESWFQEGELEERQLPPVPEGWITKLDASSQQDYYVHLPTQATQWEFPTGTTQQLKARQSDVARLEGGNLRERPPAPLPEGWIRHLDAASGHHYYIHLPTRSAQWQFPPRPKLISLNETPVYAGDHTPAAHDHINLSSLTVSKDWRDQQREVWSQLLTTDPDIAETLLRGGNRPDDPPEVLRNAINTLHLDRLSQSKHVLQDYQMQLMLLEQRNKRELMARQGVEESVESAAASMLKKLNLKKVSHIRPLGKR